jgi:hypothetical protein
VNWINFSSPPEGEVGNCLSWKDLKESECEAKIYSQQAALTIRQSCRNVTDSHFEGVMVDRDVLATVNCAVNDQQ